MDVAINMYKKARMYDQMIRLVSQYRKDNLVQVGARFCSHAGHTWLAPLFTLTFPGLPFIT